jgi:hypothetical protein
MNPQQLQNHFDAFYEDFWCEMCKYGEIEEVVVCDNNNDRTYSFAVFSGRPLTKKQILLATSTPASSTKNPPRPHATL